MTKCQTALLLTLMAALLFLATAGMFNATPTYDEPQHFRYGEKVLRLAPERDEPGFDSKMPISVLNVIPWEIAKWVGWDSLITSNAVRQFAGTHPTAEEIRKISEYVAIVPGRMVTILFSLILAWVVFTWARELYGINAALVSLTCCVLSPNILAHSNLVTVDLYAALLTTASLYLYWKFLNYGGQKWAALSALTLGLSQLAKYSCLLLYPIFF